MDAMVWVVLACFTACVCISYLWGLHDGRKEERQKQLNLMWMRLTTDNQLADKTRERNEGMKKALMLVLVMSFAFIGTVQAETYSFSETNTQEIGDEVVQACVAKGVIKGSNPQQPIIVMKVRATCSDAYTAIHDLLKDYKPPVSPLPAPKAETKETKKPGKH
jgi:hypothetical protein